MYKRTQKEETYFQLIKWLNKQGLQGCRILFDCGELGFALIYWMKSKWEVDWFEAQPIPLEVKRKVDDVGKDEE